MSDPATGLLTAMLEVQKKAPTLEKDRSVTVKTKNGGEYTYSYTPLDTIVEKIGPLLHENGLVWSTLPGVDGRGEPALEYRLSHAPTGESMHGQMPLMLAEDDAHDAQAMGSAITYARRYAICAVLNLVAEMDDDGQRASAGGGRSNGRPASDKQIALVRRLFTEKRVTQGEAKKLLATAGVDVAEGESARDACARLKAPGVSTLIDFLKEGPIATGQSDVPYGQPPAHTPAGDTSDVPFAPAETSS